MCQDGTHARGECRLHARVREERGVARRRAGFRRRAGADNFRGARPVAIGAGIGERQDEFQAHVPRRVQNQVDLREDVRVHLAGRGLEAEFAAGGGHQSGQADHLGAQRACGGQSVAHFEGGRAAGRIRAVLAQAEPGDVHATEPHRAVLQGQRAAGPLDKITRVRLAGEGGVCLGLRGGGQAEKQGKKGLLF